MDGDLIVEGLDSRGSWASCVLIVVLGCVCLDLLRVVKSAALMDGELNIGLRDTNTTRVQQSSGCCGECLICCVMGTVAFF
jgi:hypothetical protein